MGLVWLTFDLFNIKFLHSIILSCYRYLCEIISWVTSLMSQNILWGHSNLRTLTDKNESVQRWVQADVIVFFLFSYFLIYLVVYILLSSLVVTFFFLLTTTVFPSVVFPSCVPPQPDVPSTPVSHHPCQHFSAHGVSPPAPHPLVSLVWI